MAKQLIGSMCLTDLIDQAKAQHSAFSKAKNGKIYFNFIQWINDEKDQFGNDSSIQLNSKKDAPDAKDKHYIGNAKFLVRESNPVEAADIPSSEDLPI